MMKETDQRQVQRSCELSGREDDALNDANAYLLGISQLDAELDALSNRGMKTNCAHMNLMCKQTLDTKANIQKLDDALKFLCQLADINIKCAVHHIGTKQSKSPIEELDDALEFLCKIADIDINTKPEIVLQKPIEYMPMDNVPVKPDINADDSDWDEFVKERVARCQPVEDKKKTEGKVKKFFRRLFGKK